MPEQKPFINCVNGPHEVVLSPSSDVEDLLVCQSAKEEGEKAGPMAGLTVLKRIESAAIAYVSPVRNVF